MGKGKRPNRRRSLRRKRGLGAFVLPLALVLTILVAGWAATPRDRRPSFDWTFGATASPGRVASSAAEPIAETWVDPAALSFGALAGGVGFGPLDPRWILELEAVASEVSSFRLGGEEQRSGCVDLAEALASVSFVRSMPEVSADEVRGLRVVLDLASPVACVPVGANFLCVDRDGVLLSGAWPAPVEVEGVPLPVIGPMSDADELFARALPGDWLEEQAHLDALDVVLSMREHLDRVERVTLGRVVIDATRARVASVEEPGIRLFLGDRRLVLFGRRPSTLEPGELPVEQKWASLALALDREAERLRRAAQAGFADDLWGTGAGGFTDWSVLDVRWDRPGVVLRGGPRVATAEGDRGVVPRGSRSELVAFASPQ